MNPLIILIPVVLLLAGVLLVAAARRRDTGATTGLLSREAVRSDRGVPPVLGEEPRPSGVAVERAAELERRGGSTLVADRGSDIAEYVPPDPETIGVTRRQFFNRAILGLMILSLSTFGAAVLAFLWPQPRGGFGARIRVGNVEDVLAQISAAGGFLYMAEGRMWLTEYPATGLASAAAVYPAPRMPSMEAGVSVLFQKCPHLGCKVPECATSQWFECPCHGSQYNQAGERRGGPAPRGMDGFATEVAGGVLTVDTGRVIQGPPLGVNTTGQEAEGPHCVGAGGH